MTSSSKDSSVRGLPQASGSAAPDDPLGAMLATLIQETVEREFTQFLGAQRFERSPGAAGCGTATAAGSSPRGSARSSSGCPAIGPAASSPVSSRGINAVSHRSSSP